MDQLGEGSYEALLNQIQLFALHDRLYTPQKLLIGLFCNLLLSLLLCSG